MATKIEINENSIIYNGEEHTKKQKQPTPKDGEVWYVETATNKWVFIYHNDGNKTSHYHTECVNEPFSDSACKVCEDNEIKLLRPATPEEAALLHSKLAEKGKRWNAEKKCLEDLPKPLKRGELVIGWDNGEKYNAIIGTYNGERHFSFVVGDMCMDNAIPFESIEQYKEFIKG